MTPQRHFSQIICRHAVDQPAAPFAFPCALADPLLGVTASAPDLCGTFVWVASTMAGLGNDGGVDIGGILTGAVVTAEPDEAVDDAPRSFAPMFGRSRKAAAQNCSPSRFSVDQHSETKTEMSQPRQEAVSFPQLASEPGVRAAPGSAPPGGASTLTSGNASLNFRWLTFHPWLRAAYARLSASVVVTDPVVISSESMNDSRPVNLLSTSRSVIRDTYDTFTHMRSRTSSRRSRQDSTVLASALSANDKHWPCREARLTLPG